MPASATLFRSRPNLKSTPETDTSVPEYAVLLWHNNDGAWDSTSKENGSFDGAYNPQYYRRLDNISRFPVFPDAKQKSYPIIRCVADDANWKTDTGKLESAEVSFDSTVATLLETAGGHSPATSTSMLRTNIYNSSGFQTGDTATTNTQLVYRSKRGPHAGHSHYVDNVRDVLLGINFGDYNVALSAINNPYKSKGFQTLQVDILIRDPALSGGTTQLNWFPKNVIVFGAVLPQPYYTRTDTASGNMQSANGKKFLPLLAKHPNVGVEGDDSLSEFMRVFAQSSYSGEHTHDVVPVKDLPLSNRTNQTGYTYNAAGSHAHIVEYQIESFLKSKILKAWVTTEDKTPISDGVILLYAIGPGTGYEGPGDDSSVLPPNWHFCDGNNGTPDLRDYYIMANFADEDHDIENWNANDSAVMKISSFANGQHTHYSAGTFTGLNGTMIDVGGHGYESSLDHTHAPSSAISFKKNPTDVSPVTNFKEVYSFEYSPPTVRMAFIMYNAAIP